MESSIEDLIKVFSRTRHTCIPIIDSNANCFGIVSAIDVFDFLSSGGKPKATNAWEICSHRVINVPLEFNVREAAHLMSSHSIHHLIICDNKRPVGILSSLDIIRMLQKTDDASGLDSES